MINIVLAAILVAVGREPLWPEGKIPDFQDHQIAAMTDESEKEGFDAAAHRMPYLEWAEPPAKPNGACMILISGGAYQDCCDVGLIKMWRRELTARGFQTVNFVYRTPRPKGLSVWQTAWEDGQRAVRLVRSQAKERGYDPEKIGVIGMSAGGHLTCLLATSALTPAYAKVDALDDVPCHINWAIANAPAYATVRSEDGSYPKGEGITLEPTLSSVFKFDEKTCPISFQHGGVDRLATPCGSTLLYRKLRQMGIPTELHLYADCDHAALGFERTLEFMNQMNFVGAPKPKAEALMERYPSNAARNDERYFKENIWPDGKTPNAQANQCVPYIEWHFPKGKQTRSVQIIYSGGAYHGNSPDGFEVAPMRRFLNERGITVVALKYRTPRPEGLPKHMTAWQDLQRTVRIVRSRCKTYDLNPNRIGIMGSSAGGHLTLMGALSSMTNAYEPIDEIDQLPCNVRWGIAIYPAYVLEGEKADGAICPELKFDKNSCPICFIHGDADGYSAMGSVKVWEKLRSKGIQCDLHTLALREHCFQASAMPKTGSYTWMEQVYDFLKRKHFIEPMSKFAETALKPYVQSGQLPGCINVFYKDGLAEVTCLGHANFENRRRISMDQVFMQCSQTKGFCGVTVAKLVEEGKLNLDDPVSKHLPEFKILWIYDGETNGVKTLRQAKNELTIRMCLNHTGGFPFETCVKTCDVKGSGWSGGAPLRQNAIVAANMPISFEPGTHHQYSNTGIDIAAAVVETVTGMRWEDYLTENVLKPLEMNSTSFWPTDEQLETMIETYECQKGEIATYVWDHGFQQRPYNDRHVFASAGAGLWTTANDQLKFYKMLMNLGVGDNGVRILKEETVKSILAKSTRPTDGVFAKKSNDGYSMGFAAPIEDREDSWFGHGGAWGTNCMVNWHKKELHLWVVQLVGQPRPWDAARNEAKNKFFETAVDNSAADAYTGRMK